MLSSFLGISQSLPSTSYIKLIDIWMIFTMIYPFAETALVCLKDVLKERTVVVKGAIISSARSHNSHPAILLIHHHPPTFADHTGPQY